MLGDSESLLQFLGSPWHLHKSLTYLNSRSFVQHTVPKPHAWTSTRQMAQREGYTGHRDKCNTVFSPRGALILLLRQFINIANDVSSTVKQVSQRIIPTSYQCATSYTSYSASNVRIIVSLNKTKESSKCLQVTATSRLMASQQCLHYDLKPHL